jgi:hypothetical protein
MLNEHGDRIQRDLTNYNAPVYFTARMRHLFNYMAYQAHHFRQRDNERIMSVGVWGV